MLFMLYAAHQSHSWPNAHPHPHHHSHQPYPHHQFQQQPELSTFEQQPDLPHFQASDPYSPFFHPGAYQPHQPFDPSSIYHTTSPEIDPTEFAHLRDACHGLIASPLAYPPEQIQAIFSNMMLKIDLLEMRLLQNDLIIQQLKAEAEAFGFGPMSLIQRTKEDSEIKRVIVQLKEENNAIAQELAATKELLEARKQPDSQTSANPMGQSASTAEEERRKFEALLEAKRLEFEDQKQKFTAALESQKTQSLAALEEQEQRSTLALQQQQQASQENLEKKLREAKAEPGRKLDKEKQDVTTTLKRQFEEKKSKEIAELQRQFEEKKTKQLSDLERRLEQKHQRTMVECQKQLEEKHQKQLVAVQEQLESAHKMALLQAKEEAQHPTEDKFEAEKQTALAALKDDLEMQHRATLERLRADLKKQYQQQLKQAQSQLKEQYEKKLSDLRAEFKREKQENEQSIARLRQEHDVKIKAEQALRVQDNQSAAAFAALQTSEIITLREENERLRLSEESHIELVKRQNAKIRAQADENARKDAHIKAQADEIAALRAQLLQMAPPTGRPTESGMTQTSAVSTTEFCPDQSHAVVSACGIEDTATEQNPEPPKSEAITIPMHETASEAIAIPMHETASEVATPMHETVSEASKEIASPATAETPSESEPTDTSAPTVSPLTTTPSSQGLQMLERLLTDICPPVLIQPSQTEIDATHTIIQAALESQREKYGRLTEEQCVKIPQMITNYIMTQRTKLGRNLTAAEETEIAETVADDIIRIDKGKAHHTAYGAHKPIALPPRGCRERTKAVEALRQQKNTAPMLEALLHKAKMSQRMVAKPTTIPSRKMVKGDLRTVEKFLAKKQEFTRDNFGIENIGYSREDDCFKFDIDHMICGQKVKFGSIFCTYQDKHLMIIRTTYNDVFESEITKGKLPPEQADQKLLGSLVYNFLISAFIDKKIETVHWYHCTRARAALLERIMQLKLLESEWTAFPDHITLQLKGPQNTNLPQIAGDSHPLSVLFEMASRNLSQ